MFNPDSDAMKLHVRNGLFLALLLVSVLFLKTVYLGELLVQDNSDQAEIISDASVNLRQLSRFKRDSKATRNLLSRETYDERQLANDVLISVKTTQKYHDTRVQTILATWFQLAKHQVKTTAQLSLYLPLHLEVLFQPRFEGFTPSFALLQLLLIHLYHSVLTWVRFPFLTLNSPLTKVKSVDSQM